MPSREVFETWRDATPENFVFAVKAGRFITHMKKLKDAGPAFDRFLNNVVGLGNKLGPVLFQLPPTWNLNLERLESFLKVLHKDLRYAFEFRNETWYVDAVYKLLGKYNCSFCIYELNGHLSPSEITADFVYVRLHGPGGKYQGSYNNTVLTEWAERIDGWSKNGKDVYLYFDNDDSAYAVANALTIKEKRLF